MRLPYRQSDLLWIAATATAAGLLWLFVDESLGWLERLPLMFFIGALVVLLALPWWRLRFGDGGDRVVFDDSHIERTGAAGARERITWADLARVEVVASGEDPLVEPPYWLFLDASGRHGCAVPGDAAGLDALQERIRGLAGYDARAEARAMAATRQERHTLWRRPGLTGGGEMNPGDRTPGRVGSRGKRGIPGDRGRR